ncbi:hypothetical protein ILUMI_09551 [Ignelater luminosus]|uniref:Solute carrier family 46 member 3 n=1 Tax=Ignelater luminosus TaxID=2038154 RepID=A0A8K0GFV6_IGNLU|nr:hypothetical protein ILUMI_09551 [Ignelater luminosus]
MFLYVRAKFHWSLETYTTYSSINTVTTSLGSVIGIYFLHKLLKINEPFVILIGFISFIGGSILCGLATKEWHIYAAAGISFLYSVISPMARSLISKLVSSNEYGKVFSFLAVCESFVDPLGSPLFIYIYNHTLLTFPGAFSLVAAGISIFGMIFSILVVVIQKTTQIQSPYSMLNS